MQPSAFALTLALCAQSTLEYASIVPSETMTYNVAKLQRILFSVWGVKPVVKCSCPGGWGADCEEAPLESVRPRAQQLYTFAQRP